MYPGNGVEIHYHLDTTITDMTAIGQRSGNLLPGSWTTEGVTLERIGTENPGGIETWKAILPAPYLEEDRQFLRLGVEELLPAP